jgi:hypothetical protein
MTLSAAHLQMCHLCVCVTAGVVHGDSLDMSIRRAFPELLKSLTTELGASRSRRQFDDDMGESDYPAEVPTPGAIEPDELITAAQAAAIFGLSKRQVLRKAHDLEGEKVGNSYVFKRNVVLAYKKAMGKP